MTFLTETKTADVLARLSQWIDDGQGVRDSEAVLWGRVSKIAEEHGEVIAALIGATGQNPRKGTTHTMGDVAEELLDVAITALCAYEHLSGNDGSSLAALLVKVEQVGLRAGVVTS